MQTSAKAQVQADKLGVGKLAAGKDGTGFIVLADAKTKKKLGTVTPNMTPEQMEVAFAAALSKA